MQHEWILLALSVIGLQTFVKTGESSLNKLVPLRSTLNTGTLSFPFLLNLFGAWPCISLQAFVCFPCCPQPEDTICCISFHQQSAIPQPEVRSSRFWLQKKSLPLNSEGFTSRSAAAMLCFLHLIYNGEEHVLDSIWNVIAHGDERRRSEGETGEWSG
jgi:hypothetical protein